MTTLLYPNICFVWVIIERTKNSVIPQSLRSIGTDMDLIAY
jgi:hypothetical protein